MHPRKEVRPNRSVEQAAVTAIRSIFEAAGHIFQPVEGSNDIGKERLRGSGEGTDVTGDLIALQVKGGLSYRREQAYAIPCSPADREFLADQLSPGVWRRA